MPYPRTVVALDASRDGATIVAGQSDGRVLRSLPGAPTPAEVMRLPVSATSVATSADGRIVVAAGGKQAAVARSDGSLVPVAAPAGFDAQAVAISSSGRTAAVSLWRPR